MSEGRGVINLANRAGVVFAGLDVPLQQLDHDGLGQVAGGASLARRRRVVKGLHLDLAKAEGERGQDVRYIQCAKHRGVHGSDPPQHHQLTHVSKQNLRGLQEGCSSHATFVDVAQSVIPA